MGCLYVFYVITIFAFMVRYADQYGSELVDFSGIFLILLPVIIWSYKKERKYRSPSTNLTSSVLDELAVIDNMSGEEFER